MEIITIQVQKDQDGKTTVGFYCSSGLSARDAEGACMLVAGQFREQAITAEVERRLAEKKEIT